MSKYTQDQLARYLEYIRFQPSPVSNGEIYEAYNLVKDVMQHHMARVPFESLSLHYSKHRQLSLDPEDLFQKIVGDGTNGRGGYCMEVNAFFGAILRTMGFSVYGAGGRVKNEDGFMGL